MSSVPVGVEAYDRERVHSDLTQGIPAYPENGGSSLSSALSIAVALSQSPIHP